MLIYVAKCIGCSINSEIVKGEDQFDYIGDKVVEEMQKYVWFNAEGEKPDDFSGPRVLVDGLDFSNIMKSSTIWIQVLFSFLYWNEENINTVRKMMKVCVNGESGEKNITKYIKEQLDTDKVSGKVNYLEYYINNNYTYKLESISQKKISYYDFYNNLKYIDNVNSDTIIGAVQTLIKTKLKDYKIDDNGIENKFSLILNSYGDNYSYFYVKINSEEIDKYNKDIHKKIEDLDNKIKKDETSINDIDEKLSKKDRTELNNKIEEIEKELSENMKLYGIENSNEIKNIMNNDEAVKNNLISYVKNLVDNKYFFYYQPNFLINICSNKGNTSEAMKNIIKIIMENVLEVLVVNNEDKKFIEYAKLFEFNANKNEIYYNDLCPKKNESRTFKGNEELVKKVIDKISLSENKLEDIINKYKEKISKIQKLYEEKEQLIKAYENSKNDLNNEKNKLEENIKNYESEINDLYNTMIFITYKDDSLLEIFKFFGITKLEYDGNKLFSPELKKSLEEIINDYNKLLTCYNNSYTDPQDNLDNLSLVNQINRIKDGRIAAAKMVLMHVVTGQEFKYLMVKETTELTSMLFDSTEINLTEKPQTQAQETQAQEAQGQIGGFYNKKIILTKKILDNLEIY